MPRPQGQNRNQNHDQNNRGGSGRGGRGGHYGENSRGGKKPYVQYQGGPQQSNYQQSYGANRNNNENQRSQYPKQQPPVPIGGLDTDNFPAFGTQPPTAGQNKKKYQAKQPTKAYGQNLDETERDPDNKMSQFPAS